MVQSAPEWVLELEARTNTHRDTETEGKVINHDDSDKWHHQWGLHADRKHTLVHEHTNTAGTLRHSSGLFLLTFPPAIELWTFTEKRFLMQSVDTVHKQYSFCVLLSLSFASFWNYFRFELPKLLLYILNWGQHK